MHHVTLFVSKASFLPFFVYLCYVIHIFFRLASIDSAAQCFVDNGLESDFMAYLTEDPTLSSLLSSLGIYVNSVDNLMNTLKNSCGKKEFSFYNDDVYK